MLPLRDINPARRFAWVTYALIAANMLIFFFVVFSADADRSYALIPDRVAHGQDYITLITSQFLHANLIHLGGNMLFLWIFGNNVEDRLGHLPFLIFYLFAGVVGGALQVAIDPTSQIPNVGASGAISGVLGAYLLWFPAARVVSLLFLGFFVTLVRVRAWIFIGYWAALQGVLGLTGLSAVPSRAGGGVAYFAHIGGFLTGLAIGLVLMRRGRAVEYRP